MQKLPGSTATTVNPISVETDAGVACWGGFEVIFSNARLLPLLSVLGTYQQRYWGCGSTLLEDCSSPRYAEGQQKLKCELSVCQLALQ